MSLWYVRLIETNRVPDWLIRVAVRGNLKWTLKRRYRASLEERNAEKRALIEKLRQSPIAIHTDDPNRQHYEVPSGFFRAVLGKRLSTVAATGLTATPPLTRLRMRCCA